MTVFNRGRGRTIPLRTMSVLAFVFFVAGAVLPSRIVHFAISASHAAMPTGDGNERAFMQENDVAMNKMMADMTVKPSGDVNRDFVDMMIPHHQGAIDMAKLLLVHGDNETLRRIAQEIIVTQQQEIVAMRLAIGEPAQPAAWSGEAGLSSVVNAPICASRVQVSRDSAKIE